jgi:hypothetical protein
MQRQDMVPRRSKHPLLTGRTRRAPLVEIRYTGLPVVKASMKKKDSLTKSMKQIIQHMRQWEFVIANKVIIATVEFAKWWIQIDTITNSTDYLPGSTLSYPTWYGPSRFVPFPQSLWIDLPWFQGRSNIADRCFILQLGSSLKRSQYATQMDIDGTTIKHKSFETECRGKKTSSL